MGIIDSYRVGLDRIESLDRTEIRPWPPVDLFCEIAEAGTITQVKKASGKDPAHGKRQLCAFDLKVKK